MGKMPISKKSLLNMASHTLPIYIDTYKLILLIFDRTSNFGREYKYTLGQDMKRDGINLVRSIYRANRSKEKRQYLEEFLDNFEILKLEVRLCKDLKLISTKQLAEISKMLDIIGKQATAWKNSSK
jgi:hypothetical protein